MAVTNVRLVLFDERLFVGGGSVNVWMIKLTAMMHRSMVEHAPFRTGELKASIESEVRHVGTKNILGTVGPTVPHAAYVLRGTGFPGKGRGGHIWTTKGFVTQDSDDAFTVLWGLRDSEGRFKRKGGKRPQRTRHAVRRRGYWLHLKPDGPFAFKVHGQEPNNFILAAYRSTALRHSSLPAPPYSVLNP